jgi:HSP20 family protein
MAMLIRRNIDYPTWDDDVTQSLAEFERLRQKMERLFDEWVPSALRADRTMGVFPRVNLTEDRENFYFRAEVPGMQAEDLEIKVTASTVSISGERPISRQLEGVSYHQKEREGGRFSRAVALTGEIKPDDVNAKLQNGVLTLRLPKTEAFKSKRIPITSAQA